MNICCSAMEKHLFILTDENKNSVGNTQEKVIHYYPRFNSYGTPIYDDIKLDGHCNPTLDSQSQISIQYCPWCGTKLPKDLSDEWFEQLDKLGYENPGSDDIPEPYKSSDWWEKG